MSTSDEKNTLCHHVLRRLSLDFNNVIDKPSSIYILTSVALGTSLGDNQITLHLTINLVTNTYNAHYPHNTLSQ